MRVPLEWLSEYVDVKKSPKEIANSFTLLGLMLEKPISNNILELEHRMDRSDWLSILGCARDLAAFEKLDLKFPKLHKEPGKPGGNVKIKVDCPEIVRRFNTRVFRNITVKESPEWLKKRLKEYGMPTINNIVDITNYVMVELGNPMHAQDLSKFERQEIVIRRAKNGEKMTTLDGTTLELDNEMFVLTQNGKPTVLGGIVGGATTAVDLSTKNIILDAGNYDQANIRKNSRKVKIQNETVSRYDKYLHPKLTEIAIKRATQLILELAGGDYYENEDYYPKEIPEKEITLPLQRIETLSGIKLKSETIKDIVTRLGYEILSEENGQLKLKVPYFRTDVEVYDDVVADILRINNYENISSQLINAAPPKEITSEIYKFEETLRDALVNLGLHEHITDPLVPYKNKKNQIMLENSQSSEKNALRTGIYETLYPIVAEYKKQGISGVGLFEIGKVYEKDKDYMETRVVEVICESNLSPYEKSLKTKEIYYGLLHILGISNVKVNLSYNSFAIKTEDLMNAPKKNLRVVEEYQNKIFEDISITLDVTKSFGSIYEKITNFDKRINKATVMEEYFDTDKSKKSVLVRLEFLERETSATQATEIKNKLSNLLKS